MSDIPQTLTSEELRQWKQRILKSYLKQFLVPPLPTEISTSLTTVIQNEKSLVLTFITPTLDLVKQVAQCYLLSFSKPLSWVAASSMELIKMFVSSTEFFPDFLGTDLAILYHGFDDLPNKLKVPGILQVAMSREARGKKTLVLLRTGVVEYDRPVTVFDFAKVPQQLSSVKKLPVLKSPLTFTDPRSIS